MRERGGLRRKRAGEGEGKRGASLKKQAFRRAWIQRTIKTRRPKGARSNSARGVLRDRNWLCCLIRLGGGLINALFNGGGALVVAESSEGRRPFASLATTSHDRF